VTQPGYPLWPPAKRLSPEANSFLNLSTDLKPPVPHPGRWRGYRRYGMFSSKGVGDPRASLQSYSKHERLLCWRCVPCICQPHLRSFCHLFAVCARHSRCKCECEYDLKLSPSYLNTLNPSSHSPSYNMLRHVVWHAIDLCRFATLLPSLNLKHFCIQTAKLALHHLCKQISMLLCWDLEPYRFAFTGS